MALRYHLPGILVAQFVQAEVALSGDVQGFVQQLRRVQPGQLLQLTQVLLAVGGAPAAQPVDTGVVAQGSEHVVQGFAGRAVHLHVATGDHGQGGGLRQLAQGAVAGHLVVAQQVADSQPYPAFAQARQLHSPGAVAVAVLPRKPDQQAALEVEDHVPQRGPVLPLGAAAPGHADQSGQLTVGRPGGCQCHQPDAFFQGELAADKQLEVRLLCRHVGLHHPRQGALVGDGQRPVAQLRRPLHQFLGMGGTAQEAVAAEAVEFGVGHDCLSGDD